MIAYFPKLFEDELVYSLFARFYSDTGFLVYRDAAELLFQNPYYRPSIELINNLTVEATELLEKQMPLEQIIERHTMLPAYIRFMQKERRNAVYQSLVHQDGNKNIFPKIAKTNEKRYLRYCPLCSEADRQKHGITYWHRAHQLVGVNICVKHHVYLQNSDVAISGSGSPDFFNAEQLVPEQEQVRRCYNHKELELAEYIIKVFDAPLDLKNEIRIGEFLSSRVPADKYYTDSGAQRDVQLLHNEYAGFYKDVLSENILNPVQLQKLLCGKRLSMYEICQFAFFLGISTEELTNIESEKIDSKRCQIYEAVSRKLEIDMETVQRIDEAIAEQERLMQFRHAKSKRSEVWNVMDAELLPKVKEVCSTLYNGDGERSRPAKVGAQTVQRMLGLPDKRLDKLPMSKAEINKWMETQAHYWARELVWAVKEIEDTGQPMNWKHVRVLTNLRKRNVEVALSELKPMDERVFQIVKDLL